MYKPMDSDTISERQVHARRATAAVEHNRRVDESVQERSGRPRRVSAMLASALRRAADHLDPAPARSVTSTMI